jgi:hypothetical protein
MASRSTENGHGGEPGSPTPHPPPGDGPESPPLSSPIPPGLGALPAPWGVHPLSEDQTLALRFGARDLWLRRREREIWLSEHDRGTDSGEYATWGFGTPPADPVPDSRWTRWATPGEERNIILRPTLPDRPLVLEPEWPFRLLPGAEAKVFVRVALWIRVEIPLDDGVRVVRVKELPSIVLSDTWWGDLFRGELGYWLPTTARRSMAPRLFAPHLAACPLVMRNESDEDLQVDKLALRADHLSLFASEGRMWSDESSVTYRGLEEGSQIDMTGRRPAEAGDATLVAEPRTPVQRGFRARTFDRLRSLPGLGGSP